MSVYNAVPENLLPLAQWFEKHCRAALRGVTPQNNGNFHLDFVRSLEIPVVVLPGFASPPPEWKLEHFDFTVKSQVFRAIYWASKVGTTTCNLHLAAYNPKRLAREEYPTVWERLAGDDPDAQ